MYIYDIRTTAISRQFEMNVKSFHSAHNLKKKTYHYSCCAPLPSQKREQAHVGCINSSKSLYGVALGANCIIEILQRRCHFQGRDGHTYRQAMSIHFSERRSILWLIFPSLIVSNRRVRPAESGDTSHLKQVAGIRYARPHSRSQAWSTKIALNHFLAPPVGDILPMKLNSFRLLCESGYDRIGHSSYTQIYTCNYRRKDSVALLLEHVTMFRKGMRSYRQPQVRCCRDDQCKLQRLNTNAQPLVLINFYTVLSAPPR